MGNTEQETGRCQLIVRNHPRQKVKRGSSFIGDFIMAEREKEDLAHEFGVPEQGLGLDYVLCRRIRQQYGGSSLRVFGSTSGVGGRPKGDGGCVFVDVHYNEYN